LSLAYSQLANLAYSQLAKTFKEKQEKTNSPEPESPENKLIQRKGLLSWAAFLFSISVVIISLVSVVFPALIASSDSTISELQELGIELGEVDPFSIGFWALALVAANIVVFGIAILYFKNKLPSYISKSIEFIFNFEVSKKITFLIIVLLLAIYVASSAGDLFIEEEWEDYPGVKQRIESWSPEQITSKFEPHVRYFFLWSSFVLFGNYTIIPFIASISLLLLTYFFTAKISKKRFAGIIAFLILIHHLLQVFLYYY
jgi:magnesium-transporting ATPase (P-type)